MIGINAIVVDFQPLMVDNLLPHQEGVTHVGMMIVLLF
jgi:hypothetical protein